MLTRAALALIDGYQRHISPRKGYACAYRVLHASDIGCSGFAKHAIRDNGLWAAVPLVRARFAACKAAALALSQQTQDEDTGGAPRKKPKKDHWIADCCTPCGSGNPSGGSKPDCTPDCDVCSCGP